MKLQINFKITNIMYVELSVRATSLLLFDSFNLFLIVKPQTQCERLAITIEITRFQPIRICIFPCIWFLIDWNRVIPIAIAIPSYYVWGLRVLTQQNRNRSFEMSTITPVVSPPLPAPFSCTTRVSKNDYYLKIIFFKLL